MTEDEAKTKWCPFVRFHRTPFDTHAPNRNVTASDTTLCLGSGCMAWRSKEQTWFTNRAEAEFRRTGRRLEPTGADIDGYCGLAGAPQ